MILALDVHYTEDNATTACIIFNGWDDRRPSDQFTVRIADIAPYQPGEFYKRELPCLLKAIEQVEAQASTIVIDGYVWLDDNQRKGLGAHLFQALEETRSPLLAWPRIPFAMPVPESPFTGAKATIHFGLPQSVWNSTRPLSTSNPCTAHTASRPYSKEPTNSAEHSRSIPSS